MEAVIPAHRSFPSMLFDEPQNISDKMRKRFLIFRVLEDTIKMRPELPPDRGYYFDLRSEIKLIRYTLEDNGFLEVPEKQESKEYLAQPSIIWYISSIKS